VRVVQVFAIDLNSFCTVLEFCDGHDLDWYLKLKANKQQLPDREARCIIMQVFSGLKYLNEQKQRIIHYDLKPANILFHKG
jgi:tousled-like kinase